MRLSERFRVALRLFWFVLLIVVAAMSLAPGDSAPISAVNLLGLSDKALHVIAYLPLALLPVLHESRRRAACCLLAAALMGVALEFGQILSPGRSFEIPDMLADFAGLAAGTLLALPFRLARSCYPR